MTAPWIREPSGEDLKLICYLLNGRGELPKWIQKPKGLPAPAIAGVRPELRNLVEAWQATGRDTQQLLESNQNLARYTQRVTAHLIPSGTGFRLAAPSLEPTTRLRLPSRE